MGAGTGTVTATVMVCIIYYISYTYVCVCVCTCGICSIYVIYSAHYLNILNDVYVLICIIIY